MREVKKLTPEERFLQFGKWAEEMMKFAKDKPLTSPGEGVITASRVIYDIDKFFKTIKSYRNDKKDFIDVYGDDYDDDYDKYYTVIAQNYDIWRLFKNRKDTPPGLRAGLTPVEDSDDNLSESDVEGERAVIPKHLPLVVTPVVVTPVKMPGSVKTIEKIKQITDYSLEELRDFEPVTSMKYKEAFREIRDDSLGMNSRGDVVDGDGRWVGFYDSKTRRYRKGGLPPYYWEQVMPGLYDTKPVAETVNMTGTTKPIEKVEVVMKEGEYTAEKLADFEEVIIGSTRFGVNVRGDTVDGAGEYKGVYNFDTKKLTRGGAPTGWRYVEMVMAGDYSKQDTIIPPL
jgi:hypothetical protein